MGVLAGAGGVCEAPRAKILCRKGQTNPPFPSCLPTRAQGRVPHTMGWVSPPWPQLKVLGLASRGHCLPSGVPDCSQCCILGPQKWVGGGGGLGGGKGDSPGSPELPYSTPDLSVLLH